MIIEYDEREIYPIYIPNGPKRTPTTMEESVNTYFLRLKVHNALMVNMVQHAWMVIRHTRTGGENEEEGETKTKASCSMK